MGTGVVLRTLLATRGGKKGDLSRFVKEAVNREVLRETICGIQARNADADPTELKRLIDEEVSASRRSFWTEDRHGPAHVNLDSNVLLSGLTSGGDIPTRLIGSCAS